MSWLRIVIDAHRDESSVIEQALEDMGAVSVSFEDRADEPVFELKPGDTPLWSETRVTGLFPADVSSEKILSNIETALGHAPIDSRIETLADQDWERVWLERFKPTEVGKNLWICPTQMDPVDPNAVTIFIDPGLAFGSGTHPTTAMCLDWLSNQDLTGKKIIDYGCGSGILAIAALKLGADSAWGVDIDPRALDVTKENARINGVEANLHTCLPEQLTEQLPKHLSEQSFDVLVANILSGPLISLATPLRNLLTESGQIALSGILASQTEDVVSAYQQYFQLQSKQLDGWTLLSGARI